MLSALWLVPALGGLVVVWLPRSWARWAGAAVALAALALAVVVAVQLDTTHRGFQFQENLSWIPEYRISYHLGLDGISVWLVLLNAFLTLIAVLATPARMSRRGSFIALLLLLEAAMAGLFLAVDLVLFYVFWEAMLIPAYFLLWVFGEGERPGRAAVKFVLYTLAGSLLMLVGVIGEYVYSGAHDFDLAHLAAQPPTQAIQFGLFFVFALAFAIKTPLFPFHSWLPDAYLAAPTPMLITFAGVMGKAGAYGLLRVVIPLLPHPVYWWDWNGVVPVLAVIGICWGALMALAQRDMKLLVAYSSVSHMGFIVLGIFAFNVQGQQGAVLQMVNHGIIVPALFLLVAWIADRAGTRDRSALAGLAPRMPVLAGLFMIVTLAALGLPGLNSFVGEFMTLLGAWAFSPVLAVVGCVGLVLAPVYMLRLFQGLMYAPPGGELAHGHGEVAAEPVARADIARGELALLMPMVALMFVLGLYPYIITRALPALGYALPVPWQ